MKLSEKIQEALRQQQEINLSDPAVQKRLAAQWGYVPADAQPAPSFADAYQGAMEEVATWKRRALEAEDLNQKFIAEINGPMHIGEPAQPAPSVPDGFSREDLEAVADGLDGYEKCGELRAELETERTRLAACGVVALANTPDSAKQAREMRPEYWSASCGDVARMVDENIKLRAMIQVALVVLDEVCGNINPERGYADELETDVKRAIARATGEQP